MADETITIRLSVVEAVALASAAENGTLDDAIDNIGWDARRKAAYRRAGAGHGRLPRRACAADSILNPYYDATPVPENAPPWIPLAAAAQGAGCVTAARTDATGSPAETSFRQQ